jgi:hypothetical protein
MKLGNMIKERARRQAKLFGEEHPYGMIFARVELFSLNVDVDAWFAKGFRYVAPVYRTWEATVRNPTVGRIVELTVLPQSFESVAIKSRAGMKLLNQLAWRA